MEFTIRSTARAAAASVRLHGRTLLAAERAEYTAVARVWPKHDVALGALVEKRACVHRHLEHLGERAVRTREQREELGL